MKKYQVVEVWYDDYRLNLVTPFKEIFDDLLLAIQQFIPSARRDTIHRQANSLLDIEIVEKTYKIEKLQSKDLEVYQWTLRWFCENGFEPFAVYPRIIEGKTDYVVYCFRREL